jgi:hypothetical protein
MRWLAVVLLAVGCKKSDPAPPPQPKWPAICDVQNESKHTCTETSDVLVAEKTCEGRFEKNAACPAEKRTGSCRLPSGAAMHSYRPTDTTKAQNECGFLHGQFVADTDLPEAGTSSTFSCMIDKSKLPPLDGTCQEQESVVDLSGTVDKINCETIRGKFAAGPCPAENRVGVCETPSIAVKSTRVFYASGFDAGVAQARCDEIKGTWKK